MKTVFLLLLGLLALPVAAENIAVAPNKAGGQIWLTDTPCPGREHMAIAYSAGKHGSGTIFGCYIVESPNVMIQWQEGDVSTFPAGAFTVTKSPTQDRDTVRY